MEVKFIPAEQLKEKPDENALGFGKYFTDYMFTMDWTKEKGWQMQRLSLMDQFHWIRQQWFYIMRRKPLRD